MRSFKLCMMITFIDIDTFALVLRILIELQDHSDGGRKKVVFSTQVLKQIQFILCLRVTFVDMLVNILLSYSMFT